LSATPSSSADDARRATERFEALLDRCERLRAGGLPFDELSELGRLYRAHTAQLARLRERDDDPAAIRHLNALCVRAYSFLYVPPPSERSLRALFLQRLPDALGRTWRVQVLAWGLLLTGIALGGALAWRDPQSLHAFMPGGGGYTPEGIDRLIASPQARADFLGRSAVPATINTFFGSQLFAHNTRVGLLAFATGMLGGVPTVLLHLYNGIVLGAFAAIFFRDPLPLAFLAWILPHGIPELTAITLCAAAGLCLGGALTLAYSIGGSLVTGERRGAAFGWLALSVQIGTAASPLVSGGLAAISLPGAFVLDGTLAWLAAGLLLLGARHLRRGAAP